MNKDNYSKGQKRFN